MKTWYAEAPSNVALIKYIGKGDGNRTCNRSLSYTLNNFVSAVELRKNSDGNIDVFEDGLPICISEAESEKFAYQEIGGSKIPISNIFSEIEKNKFLNHVSFLKDHYGYDGFFSLRSCNSFGKGVGLASSASSFAALTKCVAKAICEINGSKIPSAQELSSLSRLGSGSSCRSFFSPFVIWEDAEVRQVDLLSYDLIHQIILIDSNEKKVPSSIAHKLVKTSLLFNGRFERANQRFDELIISFKRDDWKTAYEICWAEFKDMHAMFETAAPHFYYITAKTVEALEYIQNFWTINNDGPIVTIDAGANVQLLWREDQRKLLQTFGGGCGFDILC